MDTFLSFIGSQKKHIVKNIHNHSDVSDASDFAAHSNTEDDLAQQILQDEVLNQFLDPLCFDQQPSNNNTSSTNNNINSNLNINITNNNNNYNNNNNNNSNVSNHLIQNDDLKNYQNSKEELMKIKFGLSDDSKYIHHSNIGFCYTKSPFVPCPDDNDVTTTLLPQEFQEAFLKSDDSFKYKIKLQDLPTHSRVETQIKLELSISPAPKEFLIHLPRDSITKPKFTIANNTLTDSINNHLLFMEVFIIGSQTSNKNDTKLKSCNVCKLCMRRELKRASRRKAGLVDDSSNWDINLPKRAIIFNSKEIVSFPPPSNNQNNQRNIELLSRIVCYCRHHQELDGFQILIFLKNNKNEIVGKTLSTPILIMDRKKSIKAKESFTDLSNLNSTINSNINSNLVSNNINESGNENGIINKNNNNNNNNNIIIDNNQMDDLILKSSNLGDFSTNSNSNSNSTSNTNTNTNNNTNNNNSSTTTPLVNSNTFLSSHNMINNLTNISSNSITNTNIIPKQQSNGVFSSVFSFDPNNPLGDDTLRQSKRQKRKWSQSDTNNNNTYYDTISQQRGINQDLNNYSSSNIRLNNNSSNTINNNNNNNNSISIKKEAVSPLSSDAVSPQNHITSATSVFSTTPERKIYNQSLSLNLSNDLQIHSEELSSKDNSLSQGLMDNNVDLVGDIDMNIEDVLNIDNNQNLIDNQPSIKRIIPAQGPVAGGIEITLLGTNFRPGLNVKFGNNIALATQCWSESTIVTYLPPASQAGPVLVSFDDDSYDIQKSSSNISNQIFTYIDDTDRQLIELALQIVGLKMNGKLEDAKNIAKRIVGSNQTNEKSSNSISNSNSNSNSGTAINTSNNNSNVLNNQLQLNWMTVASNKIKGLSKSSLNHEDILIKFLMMMKIPESPISSPNWAICNSEGQTMLHLASFKNYHKLCYYLIKNGSRIDYKDNNGFQPIHFSFIKGNRKIINLFIKFNCNSSNKLDNNLLLSEISDSNVLDLIDCKSKDIDDDIEFDEDFTYKIYNRRNKKKNINNKEKEEEKEKFDDEFEADDENEDDSFNDYIDTEMDDNLTININNEIDDHKEDENSFGYKLWVAMKEAITNKIVEISAQQNKNKDLNKNSESESESDALPSYDDLFPGTNSFRSLINFRGHLDNNDDNDGKENQELKESIIMNEEINTVDNNNNSGSINTIKNHFMLIGGGDSNTSTFMNEDEKVELIAQNLRSSIHSDKKLYFFWIPCMLLLSLIVIGNNLNLITLQNFESFTILLVKIREMVGSFMLGKDRFTNLINENIEYGRERMGNLINDVNDVMMTAVGR